MSEKTRLTFLVVGLSFVTAQAHHYEPINTEYAPPVEVFNLDITPQYLSLSNGDNLYLAPEIGLEIPVTPSLQIEVSIPYLVLDPLDLPSRSGFGDLELAFRARLPGQRPGPILAVNFEIVSPTGNSREGLAGEATELGIGLFATQGFQLATLFGNFSYAAEFPKEERPHENLLEYSTAVVFHPGGLFHPAIELFGGSNLTEDETELLVAPEIIIELGHHSEVKLAVPFGLTDSSPDWGLQFQLTIYLSL